MSATSLQPELVTVVGGGLTILTPENQETPAYGFAT